MISYDIIPFGLKFIQMPHFFCLMNRFLLFSFLFLIGFLSPVFGQDTKMQVESTIDRVVVFLEGAQIFRSGQVQIPAGKSTLRFTKLESGLLAESIQFKTDDRVQVLSVLHQENYLKGPGDSDAVIELKRLRKQKSDSSAIEEMFVEVYDREIGLLLANQAIGGAEGVKQPDIEAAADFFRTRLLEIKKLQRGHRERIEILADEIKMLDRQIGELSAGLNTWSSEVEVVVQLATEVMASFELRYVTDYADWQPLYDIQVKDIDSPLSLVYKANIHQSTGIVWDQVKMVLSTSNPSFVNEKPVVRPRRASFFEAVVPMPRRQHVSARSQAIPGVAVRNPRVVSGRVTSTSREPLQGVNVIVPGMAVGGVTDLNGYYSFELPEGAQNIQVSFVGYGAMKVAITSNTMDFILAESSLMLDEVVVTSDRFSAAPVNEITGNMAIPVVVASNTTSAEFEIGVPYTIHSDDNATLVDIAVHEIGAVYEYYAAPGYIQRTFLTAHLTEWEQFDLLPGPLNLFLNNTYVGQTSINPQLANDTLSISLGQDQGLVIERKQSNEFSRRQFFGNRKTDMKAYEISIRNNKSVPVSILVEDQIPISTDSDIDITLEESGGGVFNERTGVLRWRLNLASGESENLIFRYAVKYPRGRQVRY